MLRRLSLVRVAVGLSLAAALAFTVTAARRPAGVLADLTSGKVDLKYAGALAFGPDGVLFVGDSAGGSIVEIDTNDHTAPRAAGRIDIQGIDTKSRRWWVWRRIRS